MQSRNKREGYYFGISYDYDYPIINKRCGMDMIVGYSKKKHRRTKNRGASLKVFFQMMKRA